MKPSCNQLTNEQGSVLVVSLVLLVFLTIIGLSASTTAEIETRIAGNDKAHKVAFYAAEAARGYAAIRSILYGTNNITVGGLLYFPNNADPSQKYTLDSKQSFWGEVEYQGSSAAPRGSGFEVGKFKAHNYKMTCSGFGPSRAESQVEAGFYRIGF
ncbi:MAG: PilX N-terminal domain-containing pilus assembly protein [Desulfatiglandales bacterium]